MYVTLIVLALCAVAVLASCASQGAQQSASSSASASSASASASQDAPSDDELTVTSFSWSGGSGRLKGIECTGLVMRDGQAIATIVFESPSYPTVRVGDVEYDNITPGDDVSTFEIPVNLNANTNLSALTTAMSQDHWIDYVIYCGTAEGATSSFSSELDDQAPTITGFTAQGECALQHAQLVRIFDYDQGVRLVEIAASSDAPFDASNVYVGSVLRYLVVPEGVEVPAGLEKDVVIVRPPAQAIYVLSADALEALARMDQVSSVVLVADDLVDAASSVGVQQASGAGSVSDVDFRAVVVSKVDFIIADGAVLGESSDGEPLVGTLGSSAITLGIPMVVDRSADEPDEEGAREWIKVYGALMGCYDSAVAAYEAATR